MLAQGADILFDLDQSSIATPKRRVSHYSVEFRPYLGPRGSNRIFRSGSLRGASAPNVFMPMTRPDLPMEVVLQVDIDQRGEQSAEDRGRRNGASP